MPRKFLIVLAALLLASCNKPGENEARITLPVANATRPMNMLESAPPAFVPPPRIVMQGSNPNALFSQEHALTLAMPRASIAPRFAAARDACLRDSALGCTLTSATLNVNQSVSAELDVALPHDKVAVFEKRLLARMPQDGSGKVEITAQNTTVENQTQASADAERELAQAIAYRDSLEQLGKRANLTVDEVIKIHTELQSAQEAVDSAEAAKRASDAKIVLEQLTISFEETYIPPAVPSPFAHFWKNASAVLAASTVDMLYGVFSALPWLPLIALAALALARILRRRRKA